MYYNRLVLLSLAIFLAACQGSVESELTYRELRGETMGTYYAITYADSIDRAFGAEIDQLLVDLNLEVSTYIDTSSISAFNQSATGIALGYNPMGYDQPHDNIHLLRNFEAAKSIHALTSGAFDPTVMPLVNYWGFGYTEKRPVTQVDSVRIDSLMNFVGMHRVYVRGDSLVKQIQGTQLDFSAIAKGYGVDQIAAYLQTRGITNYFIDIGGEVVASGKSPRGDAWRVGIASPIEGAIVEDVQIVIPLQDRAIATSGNYRNFYEVDGKKYSHTINPQTGFPERSNLLSASVFAPDCMTADAYATACMVAGKEEALAFAQKDDRIEVYLIVATETGALEAVYSEGLKSILEINQ